MYGHGGRTPVQRVEFWFFALMRPPIATLLWYHRNNYHGWDLSEVSIRAFYAAYSPRQDIAALQGSLKDRPPAGARKKSVVPVTKPAERWGSQFGRELHVDEVGGYVPLAYAWMRVQFFAADLSYRPPYLWIDSRRTKSAPVVKKASKAAGAAAVDVPSGGGTVASMKRLIEHYRMFGHHVDRWNEPIMALRTDPGAAFRATDVADLLEEERIHQLTGVSGAHYQSGGVERQIQLMFQHVTTAYADSPWVPRELHPYCIDLYVHVSRLWTVAEDVPPVGEAFTRVRHDFLKRPVMRWGQPLMVFIPKPHRDWKFGAHAFLGMFLTLPPTAIKEGILVYNPVTRRVLLTRVYSLIDEIPSDWKPITAPLAGFMPGSVDSQKQLEEYLAAHDPDVLPFDIADADDDDDDRQLPTVVLEEVPRVALTVSSPQEVPSVKPAGPAIVLPQPRVTKPQIILPQQRQSAPYRLVQPDAAQPLKPVQVRLRSTVVGQPSVIPFELRVRAIAEKKAERARVALDSRLYDPWFDDPLLANCPHLEYRFIESSSYRKRVYRMVTPATAKKKAKPVRDPDHPTKKAALAGPYRHLVQEAIDREMSQFTEVFPAIHVFTPDEMAELVRLQYDFRWAVTSHLDITYKRDVVTNALKDVKARLVLHGNQAHKYDFDDIRSPTVRAATVKLLLSILAKVLPSGKTFTARTFDAKGAFLQTSIAGRNESKAKRDANFMPEDPIVIRLPDGRYALLLAYVYGLKQASREFQLQNDELLRAAGYLTTADPCLYMKTVGDDYIYITLHVDDFLSVATCDSLHQELDDLLTKRYGTLKRGVGDSLTYLGMLIERTPEGHVDVSGPGSVAELLLKFRSPKSPVDDYPMLVSMVQKPGDEESVDATEYRSQLGAMNYFQSTFRPDIAYLLSVTASAMQSPKVWDCRRLERGMRFIEGTAGTKIRFHRDSDFRLHAWADASFQTREFSRSQTGYCFSLGAANAMFYVKSQQQTPIAQSSTEAEYIALYHCVCEAVWLKRLMSSLLLDNRAVVIYQDNTSTIHWAAGVDNFHRTKHIERKYNFSREAWADGTVDIRFCPTVDMTADILTKPLLAELFQRHRVKLLGLW